MGAGCIGALQLVPGASLWGCNLAGLDLSGLDLTGADMSGADLTNADLSGANLSRANFTGANLTNANLTGANLTGAILAGAILLGALFVNALFFNTSFDFGAVPRSSGGGGGGTGGTSCTGPYCAGYNEATVDTGDLLCSDELGAITGSAFELHLSQQQLEERGLRSTVTDSNTSFRGATFSFTNQDESILFFRGLGLSHADFTDTTFENFAILCRDVTGARFSGVTIRSAPFASFAHATFRNSDFSHSTVEGIELTDANFTGSDISDSVWFDVMAVVIEELLVPASNANIGLQMLDLSGVDFSGSTLGLARELDEEGEPGQFRGVHVGGLRRGDSPPVVRFASWAGADLRDATITDLNAEANIFTGALTDGLTVQGEGTAAGATFDAGWLSVNWTGDYDFTGATCPNGSVGSSGNPCF